ncbi:Pet127-domain-containing protein [Sparassis crispa]|uniref:Pet127-domain-containing protein n=1 Tax=Sparassis crispa TaxID=139825 RepID=A0A401GS08_9APHY|nr:Pet127-domain-containing protein [Sparassis crispa]GBE84993.1 Pet127-domain-containing protein [Sparassis crispa]
MPLSSDVSSRVLGRLARRHRCPSRGRFSSSTAPKPENTESRNDRPETLHSNHANASTSSLTDPVAESSGPPPPLFPSRSELFANLFGKAGADPFSLASNEASTSSASSAVPGSTLVHSSDVPESSPKTREIPPHDLDAALHELSLSSRLLERITLEDTSNINESNVRQSLDFLKQIQHMNAPRQPVEASRRYRLPWYKRRVGGVISNSDQIVLTDLTPPTRTRPISTLKHGLNRVLFNSGVTWLQDPRSSVYNFHPKLKKIPKVDTFAFDRLTGFVTSSKDEDLWQLAKKEGCTFVGSTSSLTGVLSHIYFLLSDDKLVDLHNLTSAFRREPRTFTPGQRMPVSVVLRYRDGVYSVDSDVSHLDVMKESILSKLGIMMEKVFTTSWDRVQNLLDRPPTEDMNVVPEKEAYRYAKCGKFVMRAQLDCHHSSLPGTGVFDIKTRAAMPIRLDVWNYQDHVDYRIKSVHGPVESFEKEYYDLIRSAFLKYSFQARIGNMDGVFVAFHNTDQIFGFQYIPLEEMDMRLYGDSKAGPRVFTRCIGLMQAIFSEITTYLQEQDVRCTFETREFGKFMNVWIEPLEWLHGEDKPILQLDIKLWNYVGTEQVSGVKAVDSVDQEWHVSYSIAKSSLGADRILANRQAAYNRQLHMYRFGLNINDVVEHGDGVTEETFEKAAQARAAVFQTAARAKVGAARRAERASASFKEPSAQDLAGILSAIMPRSENPAEREPS